MTDLHASLATAIYRIIQEALNNALRHAQAQCIEITVSSAAGQLDIQVVDDGLGQVLLFETHGHFGLPGMRERAEALGGTLRWLQRTPTGVVIQATLPDIPKNSA